MLAEYMFGTGPGHLPDRVDQAARAEGADLVNYTDAQCLCGYGCWPHKCPASRRHWFTVPDAGDAPRHAARVMDCLLRAGLLPTSDDEGGAGRT
jgi:hypothetical protein